MYFQIFIFFCLLLVVVMSYLKRYSTNSRTVIRIKPEHIAIIVESFLLNNRAVKILFRIEQNNATWNLVCNESELPELTGQLFLTCENFFKIMPNSIWHIKSKEEPQKVLNFKLNAKIYFSLSVPKGESQFEHLRHRIEKEQLQKQIKQLEAERDTVKNELSVCKKEKDQLHWRLEAVETSSRVVTFFSKLFD